MCNQIGIIGGTGLDDPDILTERVEKAVDTPYGKVNCGQWSIINSPTMNVFDWVLIECLLTGLDVGNLPVIVTTTVIVIIEAES